ncbi:MAG: wax ester/triacylglycerol synthase family O-acyltransferase [Acidimicrobiales bacterium]
MKQLTGLDASFLYMETKTQFGHVSGLTIFDPPHSDYDPYEVIKRRVASRLHLMEPLRRRLVEVPFNLDHPYWIEDPEFDLDFHFRHIAVPPPGGPAELDELVSDIIARHIDRNHPLWEAYVIEGLEGGKFALLIKLHHAAVDGASGMEMTAMLLDVDPDQMTSSAELPDWSAESVPSQPEIVARAMWDLASRPRTALRLQARMLSAAADITRSRGIGGLADVARKGLPGAPGRALRRAIGSGYTERDEAPELPDRPAPATPFNRSITPHRTFVHRTLSLDDVKQIKTKAGVTVNDVVMTVCAGGLRRYLLLHDALPDDPLIAMVPVSTRTGEETDKWTNRVSGLLAALPTHAEDPMDRLAQVHESMQRAKDSFAMIPADILTDITQFSPPAVATRASRMVTRMRIADRVNPPINLVISNVPGARQPLYLEGSKLMNFYPVSTITEGIGLNITVQSYMDKLDFGLVACTELVPDLDVMMDCIAVELDMLCEVVGLGGLK